MLVLTRRIGESICIGDDIVVTVLAVNGQQVRLGTAAPPKVAVDREEVAVAKRLEAHDSTQRLKRAADALTHR